MEKTKLKTKFLSVLLGKNEELIIINYYDYSIIQITLIFIK